MKRLLLIPLLLGFTSPVIAKEICTLTSEVEPDVTITLKYTGSAGGIGTLNYKNKPSLGFYVGIWNGYGGQYYTARSYSPVTLVVTSSVVPSATKVSVLRKFVTSVPKVSSEYLNPDTSLKVSLKL